MISEQALGNSCVLVWISTSPGFAKVLTELMHDRSSPSSSSLGEVGTMSLPGLFCAVWGFLLAQESQAILELVAGDASSLG